MKKLLPFLATVVLSGCVAVTTSDPAVVLTIDVNPTEIVFDDSLQASTTITYSVTNTGEIALPDTTLSVLKRTPGDVSAEILHDETVSLAPQEQRDFTYDWNQTGVRSGDSTGTTYEIYTQLTDSQSVVISESAGVTVTYTVPAY